MAADTLTADPLAATPRWYGRYGEKLWAVAVALIGLAAGGICALAGAPGPAGIIWTVATLPVLAALLVQIVTSLMRGVVGLDLVAALSMSVGIAFGESLAAVVVALMYAGGELLEQYAEGRARREMTALLGRVPRTAVRLVDGRLETVPIDQLVPGDSVLVRSGETLPADGTIASAEGALLDESALTGESLPVRRALGEPAVSGSTNAGEAVHIAVTSPAAQSTYARIVRLVRQAEESKAPVERSADRLAVWFLILTLAIAGFGWWLGGDKLRALAVLVVATPCPLILALPVALISGMSRAARHGILVKSGGALEALSRARTVILDKTGTLTHGVAEVADIRTLPGTSEDDLLRLAASLDQASHHVIAEALVREASRRGLALTPPAAVREEAGAGLLGTVGSRPVVVGSSRFVAQNAAGNPAELHDGLEPGTAIVAVAVDGAVAGIVTLRDPLRPEARDVLAGLRAAGVGRMVMASGDRQEVVDAVAGELGLDIAVGNLTPPEKLDLVTRESAAAPTMMVGDGINDAPALAVAGVGIAMGARGAAASSETAGVVILVDRIDRLLKAVEIAARTRQIATQSVLGGLGLSVVGMVAAAFGLLPPVAGALAQEVIDVAVIVNALRALR
jgi:heavy metal translocating P-type ATPase